MAGDWIKVRTRLLEDPAVFRIADRLGISIEAVGGHLLRVWSWATDQIVEGNAPGVTEAHLDRIAGVTGMGAAMADVGWITFCTSGATFPNWNRHLAQGAKERALAAKRVAKHRNARGVTEALPEKRRGEKSREEEKGQPAPDGPVAEIASSCPTGQERMAIRQGLIRIGVESGAAQQVAFHPLLTLAMVKSNMASVKKSKGVKSQAAVLLTRLRRELEIAE
jgi:hypothetical protein